MALLIQVESVIMFYADYDALWWFVAGLLVVNLILVRMGIRIFNREEILSKELDELSLKKFWRDFTGYFLRPPELAARRSDRESARFDLFRFYRHDIPLLLKQQALPLVVILITSVAAVILGVIFAQRFPIPPSVFPLHEISRETFADIEKMRLLPKISTSFIFSNNLRVMILGCLVSVFSFGSLALLLTIVNVGLVSFIISEVVMLGYNPWLFVATFILPHGILEIPAVLIGLTFALRIGAALVSPP